MTRISPAPPESYAAEFGADAPLAYRIHAHRPPLQTAFRSFTHVVRVESRTLSLRLIELVRLRIAFHNQCRSCMAIRYGDTGVDEQLVCSLERPQDAPGLSDAERAALDFADRFATDHLSITDTTFDRLREHFTEADIVELGYNCALFVGFGRLAATFDLVDDLPDRFRVRGSEPITPW